MATPEQKSELELLAARTRAARDREQVTIAPDFRPHSEQPRWRKDFPIDWPQDEWVARRDFLKFMVLTSLAFVTGQLWIAAQSVLRQRRAEAPRVKIGSLDNLPVGSTVTFAYPEERDTCILIRTSEAQLLAYSQKCTHLSCPVIPDLEKNVIRCPCHEGYFDLQSGANIAGPPPRPLPKIRLQVIQGDVYAVGMETVAT